MPRKKQLKLIAVGGQAWGMGDWQLQLDSTGLWIATSVVDDQRPPLFASTLKSLAWLVNTWSEWEEKLIRKAYYAQRAKARREQRNAADEVEVAEALWTEPAEADDDDEVIEVAEPVPVKVEPSTVEAALEQWRGAARPAPSARAMAILARRREAKAAVAVAG